jgi:hypothetical protein
VKQMFAALLAYMYLSSACSLVFQPNESLWMAEQNYTATLWDNQMIRAVDGSLHLFYLAIPNAAPACGRNVGCPGADHSFTLVQPLKIKTDDALEVVRGGCATDRDCSLNGACTDGRCACDAPWRGSDCGLLATQPAQSGGLYDYQAQGYWPNGTSKTSSWGGNMLPNADGGTRPLPLAPIAASARERLNPLGPYYQLV